MSGEAGAAWMLGFIVLFALCVFLAPLGEILIGLGLLAWFGWQVALWGRDRWAHRRQVRP